jgi:hypothetical protein
VINVGTDLRVDSVFMFFPCEFHIVPIVNQYTEVELDSTFRTDSPYESLPTPSHV